MSAIKTSRDPQVVMRCYMGHSSALFLGSAVFLIQHLNKTFININLNLMSINIEVTFLYFS